MKAYTAQEINNKLTEVNGWNYEEKVLRRSFTFQNFVEAFAVMTQIAMEAEKMNHHPHWENVYNRLTISLSTHDANGITEKDFELAKRIDALVK